MIDFSDATDQDDPSILIPSGAKAKVKIEVIQTEQQTDTPYFHSSNNSQLHWLKFRLTVLSDPYKGKRFMQNFMLGVPGVDNSQLADVITPKQMQSVNFARSSLKGIIKSYRGIHPNENDNCAVQSPGDFHEMEIAATIKQLPGNNGYDPSNALGYIILCNSPDYQKIMGGETILPKATSRSGQRQNQSPGQQKNW